MGTSVNVWAPLAESIEALVGKGQKPYTFQRGEGGLWSGELDLKNGQHYQFRLNHDPNLVFPDPRSHYQPRGMKGPSAFVDHSAYSWGDKDWKGAPLSSDNGSAIIYEMHVGTFTAEGTFAAAIKHLSHIKKVATHIELMPSNEFEGRHGWGYDGENLHAIHHRYGGPNGLKAFVNAAHREGLAVGLDVQYNHLGPKGHIEQFGPYGTGARNEWGGRLDHRKAPVADYVFENVRLNLESYHLDFLRLDCVQEFEDIHTMLDGIQSVSHDVGKKTGIPRAVIAEVDFNPNLVRPKSKGGFGLDAEWTFDYTNAVYSYLMPPEKRAGYYKECSSAWDVLTSLTNVYRSGNHVDGLSGHKFVQGVSTHDVTGNWKDGSRLHHNIGDDRAKIAFGMHLASPFVPMIFAGDEFGASAKWCYFCDHDGPLAEKVRRDRPKEFKHMGWEAEAFSDPVDLSTFQASKLSWSEVKTGQHADMLNFVEQTVALRKAVPDMSNGDLDSTINPWSEPCSLSFRRGEGVQVIVNTGPRRDFRLENGPDPALIHASKPVEKNGHTVTVERDSIVIAVQPGAIKGALPYEVISPPVAAPVSILAVRPRPAEALLGRPVESPGPAAPVTRLSAIAQLRAENDLPTNESRFGHNLV